MALLLAREEPVSIAIVELLGQAMRRLVAEQIQQAHSFELVASKQLALEIPRLALVASPE